MRSAVVVAAMVAGLAVHAGAQAPPPLERVTFQQAIDRAIQTNPTVAAAAAGILNAEGLILQARAATALQINGAMTTTTLNESVSFNGSTVTPRNQFTGVLTVDQPILAAAGWARRAQARDAKDVAELTVADVRRNVALATAGAYLTILGARRVVEANMRAQDTAKAHFDLASQLERGGTGSRLNTLRAEQVWTTDQGLVEVASLAVYRAQEALGVLMGADGPVDSNGEPAFDVPTDAAATPNLSTFRTDLKLFAGQLNASERILQDSSKDRWPLLNALFLPQTNYPAAFFATANSWRFELQGIVPIFDSGSRTSLKIQRQSAVDAARANLAAGVTQASSEVRVAREAVLSGERALAHAREAADQAQQVVTIVNVSYRAGAATNIEVIDAERSARDLDNAVAFAEDTLRHARLDLLAALGRFP